MTSYKYSHQAEAEHTVRAVGRDLPLSRKASIEICNLLRGKKLEKAKSILERVTKFKQAIPFRRFTNGPGHKSGMSSGRYPIKASGIILKLLSSVESNAQFKGLNVHDLNIAHLSVQKGSDAWHYGRQKRRKMKRVHIEIVLREEKTEKKKVEKQSLKPSSETVPTQKIVQPAVTEKSSIASPEKDIKVAGKKVVATKPATEKITKNVKV